MHTTGAVAIVAASALVLFSGYAALAQAPAAEPPACAAMRANWAQAGSNVIARADQLRTVPDSCTRLRQDGWRDLRDRIGALVTARNAAQAEAAQALAKAKADAAAVPSDIAAAMVERRRAESNLTAVTTERDALNARVASLSADLSVATHPDRQRQRDDFAALPRVPENERAAAYDAFIRLYPNGPDAALTRQVQSRRSSCDLVERPIGPGTQVTRPVSDSHPSFSAECSALARSQALAGAERACNMMTREEYSFRLTQITEQNPSGSSCTVLVVGECSWTTRVTESVHRCP